MSQQTRQSAKDERVLEILEMLLAGQPRDQIADQFGYSTWKSLDIYMRRHGFSWDSQNHIYTKAVSEAPHKEVSIPPSIESTRTVSKPKGIETSDVNPADINPEEVVRLFGLGMLDARDIAKRTGFSGHKEMANYMLRRGFVWSSASLNYINSNPSPPETCPDSDSIAEYSLNQQEGLLQGHSVLVNDTADKNDKFEEYATLLEFLWQSRSKLVKLIESMSEEDKIRVYHISGQAKTKSIFLSDGLAELMTNLCEKHSLSQRQGYEAALIEYLSKYGFRDKVENFLEFH